MVAFVEAPRRFNTLEYRFYSIPRKCVNLIFAFILETAFRSCRRLPRGLGEIEPMPVAAAVSVAKIHCFFRPSCAPLQSKSSQATGLPLQSRSIDHDDFSLVWRVVHRFNRARPNRIVPDVIPFLRVTFVSCAEYDQRIQVAKAAAISPLQR